MKRIKELFFTIPFLFSYVWDMLKISVRRAKSEEIWEKHEAPPASDRS